MPRRRHVPAEQPAFKAVAAWFVLTPGERWFVAGVLAIALVGLVARRAHLRRMEATPVPTPEGETGGPGGVRQ